MLKKGAMLRLESISKIKEGAALFLEVYLCILKKVLILKGEIHKTAG